MKDIKTSTFRKIMIYSMITILGLASIILIGYSQLFVVYPIKYSDYIEQFAEENNLDTRLIYSIIAVESGYREDVISNANAIGLMQIKLETAQDMMNDTITDANLLIPEINIKCGCKYVRYLIDYYKGDLFYALCAYNAGLGNVNTWIQNPDYLDNNSRLCNIPFEETEEYINKINKALAIYNLYYKWGKIK